MKNLKNYVVNYQSNFGIGKYKVSAESEEQAIQFFNKTILRKFTIIHILAP
jgi:hypothetical protein